jgi:hypothetical protein
LPTTWAFLAIQPLPNVWAFSNDLDRIHLLGTQSTLALLGALQYGSFIPLPSYQQPAHLWALSITTTDTTLG